MWWRAGQREDTREKKHTGVRGPCLGPWALGPWREGKLVWGSSSLLWEVILCFRIHFSWHVGSLAPCPGQVAENLPPSCPCPTVFLPTPERRTRPLCPSTRLCWWGPREGATAPSCAHRQHTRLHPCICSLLSTPRPPAPPWTARSLLHRIAVMMGLSLHQTWCAPGQTPRIPWRHMRSSAGACAHTHSRTRAHTRCPLTGNFPRAVCGQYASTPPDPLLGGGTVSVFPDLVPWPRL